MKLVPLDNEQDGQRLLRKLTEQKLTKPTKRCLRPYLFAETFAYENPKVNFLFLAVNVLNLNSLGFNEYIEIKRVSSWNTLVSQ